MSKEMAAKGAPTGVVFLFAYFGAVAYFINHSDGFVNVILAFIKAIVWPAILVYNGFEAFNV
jgi:hypothetical protein